MAEELTERAHHDSPWSCPETIARTFPVPSLNRTTASKTGCDSSQEKTHNKGIEQRTRKVEACVCVIQESLSGWIRFIVVVSRSRPVYLYYIII